MAKAAALRTALDLAPHEVAAGPPALRAGHSAPHRQFKELQQIFHESQDSRQRLQAVIQLAVGHKHPLLDQPLFLDSVHALLSEGEAGPATVRIQLHKAKHCLHEYDLEGAISAFREIPQFGHQITMDELMESALFPELDRIEYKWQKEYDTAMATHYSRHYQTQDSEDALHLSTFASVDHTFEENFPSDDGPKPLWPLCTETQPPGDRLDQSHLQEHAHTQEQDRDGGQGQEQANMGLEGSPQLDDYQGYGMDECFSDDEVGLENSRGAPVAGGTRACQEEGHGFVAKDNCGLCKPETRACVYGKSKGEWCFGQTRHGQGKEQHLCRKHWMRLQNKMRMWTTEKKNRLLAGLRRRALLLKQGSRGKYPAQYFWALYRKLPTEEVSS